MRGSLLWPLAPTSVTMNKKTHNIEFKHREWQAPVPIVISIINSCIEYKEPFK